ncbi:aminodeoxychorismate/anthranilate synthase component 2 [bacterium BMS3Abin02]|nr:aminodeoxychorismate/anthranilate synthase component 2 [bacterium BMS3Abin02]GBE23226.1 aminodeoxychorismate/anthranilate synthase component 2 [bacterium BMS3Bbin01]HDH25756.1 aminodeoxychorismate/anthranilate synthase component II [Actinomycetota bacterium]HDL50163.1 aminodeoxychorismate/anthranilate synthase component II [Actinomycetota bacterium]
MNHHVLIIDNYDSFTYNLVQAFMILDAEVSVRTNDQITADTAMALEPTHLVISPGPGRPEAAGVSMDIIDAFAERIPILGVCLGHQAVAAVFGGTVGPAQTLMHGKASPVYHDRRTIFQGLSNPLQAGRYHSLAVAEEGLAAELMISAYTSEGEIMGIRHRELPIEGVQFHPESVLTPIGDRLLQNFLDLSPAKDSESLMTVST